MRLTSGCNATPGSAEANFHWTGNSFTFIARDPAYLQHVDELSNTVYTDL